MDIALLTGVITISLLMLMFLGLPVAFSLCGISLLFYIIIRGPAGAAYALYSAVWGNATQQLYIAVPLFVFMAGMLESSGLARALYDSMYKWFAGLRGGLAIGTVVICTLLAAMTGLGATGVVTMGVLALPEMLRRGYNKSIAVGCIPFGGALGPLIPPSVLMIVIGAFGGISVGKLFMGGVFPGLIASFLACVYIGIRCWRNPELAPALTPDLRATWKQKLSSSVAVIPSLALIFLVLGSIYTGVCTPTEGGGIGAIGAIICAVIYRKLNWSAIKDAVLMTLRLTAMVIWLAIGGLLFASFLSFSGVSQYIGTTLIGFSTSPVVILIVMMIITLIMGMFMDGIAITMILIPVFMPVVKALGIDPLWFALLFTINLVTGYLTPPFGMNLFYMKGVAPPDVTFADIVRSSLPYAGVLLVVLILCVIFPDIIIWLPNRMI